MAARHAIVRRLPAIETLGSVSVICTDKTGTLTRNEMTVRAVALPDGATLEVGGAGYAPHGGFARDGREADPVDLPQLVELARAAALCNDAALHEEGGTWRAEGDPMEAALLAFAMKAGLDPDAEAAARPRTDTIPFDAVHRFMATLHHDHQGSAMVLVKGAPERVIPMCSQDRSGAAGDAFAAEAWLLRAEALAAGGNRVLALAGRPHPAERATLGFAEVERGLALLGLVGLQDPPRPEAVAAVAECRAAGIRVKMITGDHAGTACAIGRQVGLANAARCVTGAEIDRMDDATLRRVAAECDVFARPSPEHKLRLVEALRAGGALTAMTGDGVNDAPALARADVGIAMGRRGTEAAKEAAQVVLADDNFASIAAAVQEGRTVRDNLRKSVVFLLPINGGESLSVLLAVLLGAALPITPVQILWVNMVSAVALAMALAFEPGEPDTMRRPPRPPSEPLVDRSLLWRVGLVSALFLAGVFGSFEAALAAGAEVELARTVAVNTLVAMEVAYLFSVRYLRQPSFTVRGVQGTPAVLVAIGLVAAMQLLFTYAPPMEELFGTRPLPPLWAGLVLLIGAGLFWALEAEKWARRRISRGR
jgi:magnesium-transporting ATPase (P-type)